jgi:hypothetical protein
LVPAFIKVQNNDYYVSINKKQKNFIRDIYNNIHSLKVLNQLENIRITYNYGIINEKLDYDKIYEKINMINAKNYSSRIFIIRTFDKIYMIKLLKDEEAKKNLINVKDIKNYNKLSKENIVYMFDFENTLDMNILDFKKFIFEGYEKYITEKISNKIPIWLTFSFRNYQEPQRKYSHYYRKRSEKYSEDEFIQFEIRILYNEFLYDNNDNNTKNAIEEVYIKFLI